MIERQLRPRIVEALGDTRVVMVMGARQVGKSTLCESIAEGEHPATTTSMDDKGARETAQSDPAGFLAGFEGPVFIDEVQRVPDLILAIKRVVDRDQTAGRFLLSGSANILSSRKVQEALTGRIELLRLWPFAQAELEHSAGNLVDTLFAGDVPRVRNAPIGRAAFASRVAAGGYANTGTNTGADHQPNRKPTAENTTRNAKISSAATEPNTSSAFTRASWSASLSARERPASNESVQPGGQFSRPA